MAPSKQGPTSSTVPHAFNAEFIQQLFRQLPATVWTVDTSLAVTSCLGLGPRLLKNEPNHNVGTTLFEHFGTDDPTHPPIAMHLRALKGQSVRYEGTTAGQPTEVTLEPMRDDAGEIVGCIAVSVDISERKRAESALTAAQRQYHDLVEHIADMVYALDRDGCFTFVNARLAEQLGADPVELIGRCAVDFIAPEDHEKTDAAFNRRLRGEVVQPYEFSLRTVNGELIPIEINSTVIHAPNGEITGTQAVLRDLRPRKRDAELLRESERRLNQLAEQSDQVIWMSDSSLRRLLFVGKAYEHIWGRSRDALLADPDVFLDAVHPSDRDRVRAHIETHRRGEPSVTTYRIIRPDGTLRWICDKSFPIADHRDQVYRAAGVAEDITEQREADERRRRQSAILEQIARNDSLQRVLDSICRGTEDLVPGMLVAILRRSGPSLRFVAGPSLSDGFRRDLDALELGRVSPPVPRGSDGAPWVVAHGEPGEWTALAEAAAPFGVRACWCLPIYGDQGAWLGTLIAFARSTPDAVLDRHTETMETMANLAGIALDRDQIEDSRTRMLRELDHRVKNNLSSLLSLAKLTRMGPGSKEEFVDNLVGRIQSMAVVHEVLASTRWRGANLRTMLQRLTSPYRTNRQGIIFSGDPIMLPPANVQPFCLAVHELATNASKYGSLSAENGVVTASWFVSRAEDGRPTLRFTWRESDGPTLKGPPAETGFGMLLIKGLIEREMGGESELLFAPSGLSCHMSFVLRPDEPNPTQMPLP